MIFKSSKDGQKDSEDNIMILFSGGNIQGPLFQTSGIPLEQENNYFLFRFLKGETTLDLAVPYGPNFLSVPSQPAKGWTSARSTRLL